jgi:hypothetical protein
MNTLSHPFVGRTITNIERMSEDEALNVFGWSKRPVIITLDTGVQLVPMADDEGNDGGALCTTDEQYPLLGTL